MSGGNTERRTRYRAAIVRDHHVLMLMVNARETERTFWVIPRGGRIADEGEEGCVRREVFEETHLRV